jgi:hypothetical protein
MPNKLAPWICVCLCSLGAIQAAESAAPSLDEILGQLEAAEKARKSAMPGYSGTRTYTVENARLHVKAMMKVEVTADEHGAKQFRIVEMKGPAGLRKLVFQRLLDTESRASTPEGQAATCICRTNYEFRLSDVALHNGRKHYVLEAVPKTANPLLFKGRLWVDSDHFAVARIEGKPAQNPSFWVKKTHFVHDYRDMNGQWLAVQNQSDSDIRVFGRSSVRIEYQDYRFRENARVSPGVAAPAGGVQ